MSHSHHQHMLRHVHDDTHHLGSPASGATRTLQLVERANPVLVARETIKCTSNSEPGCTKPTQVPMLVIALAIVIPVVGIAVVLTFLHRRNKRKLREEDQRDKYKSHDWGMEGVTPKGGKKGGPEMSISEKEISGGHDRGLSIETGSPYILPPGLHGSRESFHSLSRSQHDPHDPYGPVAFLRDDQSLRSQSLGPYKGETGSVYTASSSGTKKEGLQAGLLQNAQRMSTSIPVRGESLSPDGTRSPDSKFPEPGIPLSPLNPRYEPEAPAVPPASAPAPTPVPAPTPAPASATPVASKPTNVPIISIPEPPVTEKQVNKSPVQTTNDIPSLPRIQSQAVVLETANTHHSIISTSSYGDGFEVTPPSPRNSDQPTIAAPKPRYSTGPQNLGLGVDDFGHSNNRLSMSLRPMPSEDPMENPEERANRIRSFYKEYFDDSKPEPVGGHQYADYVEDYGSEYQDGTVFDSRTGNFVVAQPNAPFAEPITRRAMTPPPRAPPRFRSNTATGPRGPHMSNGSVASSHYQPPRGMSSMSGRLPPPMKKPLPPPAALSSLPTPAKLNENSMVFDAADFAPPVSFRERQNGMRPDSPLGNARPYSPSVRPHTPLVGSYDELPVLPSPHLMRKSGTFTALDFAPPGRIRDPAGGGSDAGSIRSNRSGISAAGRFAVRSGANRVSRIPRELMGTRDDIALQLRPRMNLVESA